MVQATRSLLSCLSEDEAYIWRAEEKKLHFVYKNGENEEPVVAAWNTVTWVCISKEKLLPKSCPE